MIVNIVATCYLSALSLPMEQTFEATLFYAVSVY